MTIPALGILLILAAIGTAFYPPLAFLSALVGAGIYAWREDHKEQV